jgi:hypothetical protein
VLIASITLAFCGALLMFAEDGLMGMFLGALAALEFFGLIVIPASIIVGFIGKYAVSVLTRRSTWTRRT